MPTPHDEEFVRFAVAGGHLTPEQGEEALAALAEIESLGGVASAADMLERRGLLDKRQIGVVREAIAASRTATTVPRELGSFELLEKIGQGSTATVFKGRQRGLDRFVAVKVLAPRLAEDDAYLARFRREARAAARLTHPNIVAAIDVGEAEGFHYVATEFIEGESLSQVLAREGRLSEARALAIAIEVAGALDHAYAKGVLHRDIRPDNILITPDGQVRVADFGFAKAIGADAPRGSDADRFLGNPAYLAPEELRADPDVDCRADIYSLGITLYQMLTGGVPFQGATPMAVAAAAVSEPVPSVRTLVPDVRIATARVIERMVAKDRSARFATPGELHAALRSAAGAPRAIGKAASAARASHAAARAGGPSRPGPARAEPRRRKSRTGAYIIAAIGLAAHVAIFFVLFPKVMKRWEKREAATATDPTSVVVPAPPTRVPVIPRTSTPPPAVDPAAALREIRAALDSAVAFAASHPDAYASRAARLRKAVAEFSGPKQRQLPREGFEVLLALRNELKRAEQAFERAVAAELGKRKARADEHFQAGRVAEALAEFDSLPRELTDAASTARLRAARSETRDRALDAFRERDARAKALIGQAELDEARSIYRAVQAWGIPEISRQANAQLKRIDGMVARQDAQARKAALAAFPKLAMEIMDHLGARDYKAARTLVDSAIVDPKLEPIRERLRPFQELVRGAGEIWAQALASIGKLERGDSVRIGGVAAEFDHIEADRVHVRIGPAVAARPLTDLKSREAVEMATEGRSSLSRQEEYKVGLFLLADRDYLAARTILERARKQGIDADAALDILGRVAPRPCKTCKGEKTIACPNCGGKGYTDVRRERCEECNGRGWFLCRKCRGRGYLTCPNCGGRGVIAGGFRCMQCYGKGTVDCPSCRGGRIKCKACGGDGVKTHYTVCTRCKGKKQIQCPSCGGKGYLPPLGFEAADDGK